MGEWGAHPREGRHKAKNGVEGDAAAHCQSALLQRVCRAAGGDLGLPAAALTTRGRGGSRTGRGRRACGRRGGSRAGRSERATIRHDDGVAAKGSVHPYSVRHSRGQHMYSTSTRSRMVAHGAMAADSAVEAFDSMFDSRCPSVLLLICGFCGYCMARPEL
jgi:hypothetical protein